jgi:hypothetical protein
MPVIDGDGGWTASRALPLMQLTTLRDELGSRFSRPGRWSGSKSMTAHHFTDHLDVRRAITSKDVGDIPEVDRAQETRTDDGEKTGVDVAAVIESVDHAPRYEECFARV